MLEATIGLAARERPSSGAAGGGSRGSPTRLPRDSTDAEASPRRSDRPWRRRSRPEGDAYDVSASFKGSVSFFSGSDESDDDAAENAQRDGKGSAAASPRRSDTPWRRRSRPEGNADDVSASFKGSVSFFSGSDESDERARHARQQQRAAPWSWMDAEEDFPGLMSFGLTDDDPESSDEADWRTDDDSDPHFDSQTGTDDDSDPHFDSSAGAFSYGEWKDGDESAEAPEVDRSTMSRRDRIRFGHDPEKTSCWTARNKNRMADSLKRKFLISGSRAFFHFRRFAGVPISLI